MSIVFLIGMPGTGKTYWANKVAAEMNCEMIDMDEYIEDKHGETILEMFSAYGEAYFRDIEQDTLIDLIDHHGGGNLIVAAGGGTPAFDDNIDLMKRNGCVVFIDTDLETIHQRVLGNDDRPLLEETANMMDKLAYLYDKRLPYYSQAHYTLKDEEITIDNIEKIVARCTSKQ